MNASLYAGRLSFMTTKNDEQKNMNIDWQSLGTAFALVLVIEGLAPTLNPKRFRAGLIKVASLPERLLRLLGLVAMCAGALVLAALH